MNIDLHLLGLKSQLLLKKERGKRYLFGNIRKKYLVLQPEELVRQLAILYLIQEKDYPKNFIAVEKELIINGLKKRCDILIFNNDFQAHLLIECKAPSVPIDEKTFRQIAWYNMPLKVEYLMVTNGIDTYCCKMNYEKNSYDFLREIPSFAPSK